MTGRRRSLPTLAIVVLVVLGLPAGIAVVSTESGANFADDERFTGNRLGAGSVDIAVDGSIDGSRDGAGRQTATGDPSAFSATNLAPGDRLTGALEVNNAGTLPFRFWITANAATSTRALGDWLLFDGWAAADCRTGPDEADRVFKTNVVLGPAHVPLIGDADDPGDGLRLEPGEGLVVCVGAHLPLAAPNEVQSARVEVELLVRAQHALEEG